MKLLNKFLRWVGLLLILTKAQQTKNTELSNEIKIKYLEIRRKNGMHICLGIFFKIKKKTAAFEQVVYPQGVE